MMVPTNKTLVLGLFALASCGGEMGGLTATNDGAPCPPGEDHTPPVASDTEPDTEPATDTETGTDTDPETPGTGDGEPAEPEPPAPVPVRFIALGDGGTGGQEQYDVAAAMETVCAANGCDFAIYTGDVIYSDGVSDVYDSQFQDKFESPYANLNFPFYISVGNHDHGGDVGAQVAYTAFSTKWTMPAQYYTFQQGDVTFFALDTDVLKDGDPAQETFIADEIAAANTTWKIIFGHHPYISNGSHGDTGGDLEAFFNDYVCGAVDISFSGHDHDLQWLEPQCGTEYIISGAAGKLRDVGGGHPTFFETSTYGFMWVEILGNQMTGVFYDDSGSELFRRTITK